MLTDTIAAIPPLQHGDLQALGLCHWTPAGLVQYSFELVHVFTGLPWFHTFVVAAFLWRVIIFPFAVLGTRHSARMRPIQTEMGRLQEQALAARRQGDTLNMQRLNVAAGKLRADAGVSMAALMAPMIQIPISIGMFFGIKRMCELPVIQLTQSGFDWIPDLTQPGPYYILPILVAASGNLMISMGARDLDPSRPVVGHVMNGFRIVSVLAIWWMNSFPSGLLLTLLVTSLGTVAQGAVFRMPAVRAALDIPQWTPPPADAPKLPTLRDTFREYVLGQRTQPGAQRPAVTPRVQAYVPPKAPRTLDVIAEQAQAHPSVNASSLYEEPIAPPPPKITPKKNKAARKAKSGRN
ncbi:60Kd inner membrane protein-domain-containing protein [Mycena galericulata]|nr:60Kd inner membrane protein-domain-containing protein [Mycena galericulata]